MNEHDQANDQIQDSQTQAVEQAAEQEKRQPKPKTKKRKIGRIIGIIIALALVVTIVMVVKVLNTVSPALHTVAEYQEMFPAAQIEQTSDESIVVKPTGTDAGIGIIFYCGAQIPPAAYTPVMAELAERGYTCFVPKLTCNFAPLSSGVAGNIIAANPQIERWYIGGHSMGGLTAAGYAADNASKFDGIIFLAAFANDDLTKTGLPLLSILGSEDAVLSKDSYEKARSLNPPDFEERTIEGANHGHVGDYGEQLHDNPSTISPDEQWETTADIIMDWIARH